MWLRVSTVTLIVVLLYGGGVHVYQLAVDGWPPYAWAPPWLAAYFTALTVLDPLAAILLWTRRPAGAYLAAAVLVTDALANAYATYVLLEPEPLARIGQAVITALAVVAIATARTGHRRSATARTGHRRSATAPMSSADADAEDT
ncbi:hypothetical protein [Dactylosporangium sp. NPDC051541]|uniref:hypothetical protein n=1 Tax=Dactylosporangium sp. NPDC051541 TaxID=3363977 RepID=UPI0037B9044C